MYDELNGREQQNNNTEGQNPYAPNWQYAGQNQQNQQTWQSNGQNQQSQQTWQSNGQNQQGQQTWQSSGQNQQGQQTWQSSGQARQNYQTWDTVSSQAQQDAVHADRKQKKQERKAARAARKQEKKARKAQRGLGAGKAIAIGLCCSLVGGAVGAGSMLLGARYLAPETPQSATVFFEGERPVNAINVAQIDTSKELSNAEIYAMNVNSTVGITTSIVTNFFGYQTTTPASGSGFVLTADGYIVTNYHVVEDSSTITVTTYDGTAYDAELIGYDESNDIAVLKVDAKDLTPVVLGDSDTLNVGDRVVAIGNPLGELTFSLASGFVSALDRSVTFSTGATMDLIQLNCAINAGNSGGALFNAYGEVVGITNAKYSNNGDSSQASIENIGFAIPLSHVQDIVESIIKNGYISKPYIGISMRDVTSEMEAYGIPLGAAIVSVEEDGPADKAGLQASDIVTAVNGQEITSGSELKDAVNAAGIGGEVKLTVYRKGETLELTITVEEKQESALANEENQQQQQQQYQQQQQQPNGGNDQGGNFSFPWNFFGW